jgi:hypothetical protein
MSSAWKLLRAPLLCTVGLTYEAYVVWQIFHSAAWVELSQPEQDHLSQQQQQHLSYSSCLAPLLFATSLATAMIFCYGCALLWWYDVYHVCVVESPTVRTLVATALSYSLDDVMTVLCDPTRLATYAVGAWLLPTTLYGLPYTTAAQRSRVLRAAGFLPAATTAEGTDDDDEEEDDDNDDEDENGESKILMQPGGWMKLLPKKLQTILHSIVNGGGEKCDTNGHDLSPSLLLSSTTTNKSAMNLPGRMANDSMDHASSTDDEDENDGEREYYFPYSVSPIYAPNIDVIVDGADDDDDDKEPLGTERQEMEHGEELSLEQGGGTATMPLQSVEIELYQVVAASVRRVLQEKLAAATASIGREEEEQQQQRRWLAVAIACTGLFVLQQRHVPRRDPC